MRKEKTVQCDCSELQVGRCLNTAQRISCGPARERSIHVGDPTSDVGQCLNRRAAAYLHRVSSGHPETSNTSSACRLLLRVATMSRSFQSLPRAMSRTSSDVMNCTTRLESTADTKNQLVLKAMSIFSPYGPHHALLTVSRAEP